MNTFAGPCCSRTNCDSATEITVLQWEDVVGLSTAKAALKEDVAIPLQYPHIFANSKMRPFTSLPTAR